MKPLTKIFEKKNVYDQLYHYLSLYITKIKIRNFYLYFRSLVKFALQYN